MKFQVRIVGLRCQINASPADLAEAVEYAIDTAFKELPDSGDKLYDFQVIPGSYQKAAGCQIIESPKIILKYRSDE